MSQGQDYNMITRISSQIVQCPQFQQEQTTTKWQCLNIKLPTKHETSKFANKETKKWTHLEVFFGVWSMGLGGALLPHSIQGMGDIFSH